MTVERFELVLLVAAIVALAARRTRVPYTVGLVVTGSLLASIGALPGIELTKEFIFGTLLPPLIFEAAIFIHWKELRVNLLPVVALATGGVLIGGVVVASIMVAAEGWTWPAALAFGALIAATDPVSVIAMFKELKIGGRLRLLVEAESLLNDGVAAVAFAIALLAASGTSLSTGVVFVEVLKQAGGGLLCGAFVGGIVLFLAGRTTDHLVELTFSAVAAFGSFMLAEHFGCSGVLAGLVAGLMFGSLGHRGAISEGGQDAQNAFWEFAAFIANSVISSLSVLASTGCSRSCASTGRSYFWASAVHCLAEASPFIPCRPPSEGRSMRSRSRFSTSCSGAGLGVPCPWR